MRCPHATTASSDFTTSDFLNRFTEHETCSFSKREAVAARTEETSVAIARGFDAGQELMRRMCAALRVEPQGFFATEPVFIGIHGVAANGLTRHQPIE